MEVQPHRRGFLVAVIRRSRRSTHLVRVSAAACSAAAPPSGGDAEQPRLDVAAAVARAGCCLNGGVERQAHRRGLQVVRREVDPPGQRVGGNRPRVMPYGDHVPRRRRRRLCRREAHARRRPRGGDGELQTRPLQLLPLLLVRVLVAAERLRVGELAAAVLALVPPPVAAGRGRRGGRSRRRGRVRAAASAATVAPADRRVLRLSRVLLLVLRRLLLGDVEAEEL